MSFQLSRAEDQSIDALLKDVDSGTTAFLDGALLLKQADDEWAECGADPTEVSAVALHRYGANTGVGNVTGRHEFPPNKALGIPVAGRRRFTAEYVGTPALGDFGVIKDTDDKWKIDFNETTTDVVTVTKIPSDPADDLGWVEHDRCECYFIASVATDL